MARSVEPLVYMVEREGGVDRGAPDEQPVRVDETARRERTVIGRHATLDDTGQEPRRVERPGGRADDEIEAVEQSPALERARHARRDDSTHPAPLQHEREQLTIRTRSEPRATCCALTQKRQHRVRL